MTKEKEWPANLGRPSEALLALALDNQTIAMPFRNVLFAGLLDWDKTSIVFTKRSLIEFLR